MNFINRIRKHKKYVILSMVVILALVFSLLPSDTAVIEEEANESVSEEVIIEEELPIVILAESFDDFIDELEQLKQDMNERPTHVYRVAPPMVDPNFFVMPNEILDWQAEYISRWDDTINLYLPIRPELDLFLILSVIGQESQGDENLVAHNPDFINNSIPGVGLMMITPRAWTGTIPWLLLPLNNINVGSLILNATIRDATEIYNFAPGLDSIRAGLAAYNCGWVSFLADKCYSFGGWTFADKVLLYWYPMLLERYEGEIEAPYYFKELKLEFKRLGL